ncbi:SDR family NAD(P)-dependent oxidoreductase [Streptomyces sp. WMMC940]|uniref:SDR family NAD(P)-dependent oxidoreductase n=1 Tax=Streptomyces sp. WMMC940 TaxID=3015153 RepID=UPI0022B6EDAE|nr:SDR family oxidoreductase [Streptomyces sp. WMMC940]MCZ7456624.1 SDR family oxidoreductase [Streptomyces sp. WMMC940]
MSRRSGPCAPDGSSPAGSTGASWARIRRRSGGPAWWSACRRGPAERGTSSPGRPSKAAIEHLTRSWALELAPEGVRVNAVAPGPVESDALTAAGLPPAEVVQIKKAEAARIPLGRRGRPEEIAVWVLRLADPTTEWPTGQVLTVDGGLEVT